MRNFLVRVKVPVTSCITLDAKDEKTAIRLVKERGFNYFGVDQSYFPRADDIKFDYDNEIEIIEVIE
jgi:hypothetical protein